jgi:hypothetical protein
MERNCVGKQPLPGADRRRGPEGLGNIPIEASESSRGMFPFWEDGNVPHNAGEGSRGTFPSDPPPATAAGPPPPAGPRRPPVRPRPLVRDDRRSARPPAGA